jgi:hypothetical protein
MRSRSSALGKERRIDGVTIRLLPAGAFRLEGRILSTDAVDAVQSCLLRFHEKASKRSQRIVVDVASLEWISDAAVTVLVSWILKIQREQMGKQYLIEFHINSSVPWQRGTFFALARIAPDVVSVAGV